MRHAGLPLLVIVLCASTLFAQDHQTGKDAGAAIVAPAEPAVKSSATPNPEPWRIIPKASEPSKPAARFRDESQALTAGVLTPRALAHPDVASPMGGTACYFIRSYLVARDSKDSDSTHIAGISTCQPARQYELKTTDPQPHMIQP
jgi:hypothetical protein